MRRDVEASHTEEIGDEITQMARWSSMRRLGNDARYGQRIRKWTTFTRFPACNGASGSKAGNTGGTSGIKANASASACAAASADHAHGHDLGPRRSHGPRVGQRDRQGG
jgi:hypothetical protein